MISRLYAKFCAEVAEEVQRRVIRAELRRRAKPLHEMLGDLTWNDEEALGIEENNVYHYLAELLDMLEEEDEG